MNYKLLIQYDGTEFAGWQIQKNANTVQAEIVRAIRKITREEVNLIGSGRTDTGVHAYSQAANFKTDQTLEPRKLSHSLNAILPKTISIKEIRHVSDEFHSRFSAVSRSYLYLFSRIKSPFYDRFSYTFTPIFDFEIERVNKISKYLIGNKDFTSFAKKNSPVENKFCNLTNVHWRRMDDRILFHVSANRFLHGMVRTILGTLLKSFEKQDPEEYLQSVLDARDRTKAGEAIPAKGLFLFKVRYEE